MGDPMGEDRPCGLPNLCDARSAPGRGRDRVQDRPCHGQRAPDDADPRRTSWRSRDGRSIVHADGIGRAVRPCEASDGGEPQTDLGGRSGGRCARTGRAAATVGRRPVAGMGDGTLAPGSAGHGSSTGSSTSAATGTAKRSRDGAPPATVARAAVPALKDRSATDPEAGNRDRPAASSSASATRPKHSTARSGTCPSVSTRRGTSVSGVSVTDRHKGLSARRHNRLRHSVEGLGASARGRFAAGASGTRRPVLGRPDELRSRQGECCRDPTGIPLRSIGGRIVGGVPQCRLIRRRRSRLHARRLE